MDIGGLSDTLLLQISSERYFSTILPTSAATENNTKAIKKIENGGRLRYALTIFCCFMLS